jgi:CRP-like cAMP-binding protein
VREGEIGDRFFIISQGELIVTKGVGAGESVITHLYEVSSRAAVVTCSQAVLCVCSCDGRLWWQGHFFGETSLVKNEPRNANVKVKSDTACVMSIAKDVFNPFLVHEPGFRRFIGACRAVVAVSPRVH